MSPPLLLLLALLPAGAARAEDAVLVLPRIDAAGPAQSPHAQDLTLLPQVASTDQLSAGVDASLARDLLVWEAEDGTLQRALPQVARLDLRGAWASGPLRLGLGLPLHLATGGDLSGETATAVAGDARLEGGLDLLGLAGVDSPLGLGLLGGVELPLGASAHGLGQTGPGGDAGLLVDLTAGPLWVGARGAAVLRPRATARDVVVDDAVLVSGGATLALGATTRVGAEAWTERPLGIEASPQAAPAELRGVLGQQLGNLDLRAWGGGGLGPAVGTPTWRAGVGLGWGVDAAAVTAGTAPPDTALPDTAPPDTAPPDTAPPEPEDASPAG